MIQRKAEGSIGAIGTAGVQIPSASPRRWLRRAARAVGIIALLSLSLGAQAQGPRQLNRWRDGLNVRYKESRETARYVARRQKQDQRQAGRKQRAAQAQARRQHRAAPKQPKRLKQSKL